MRLREHCDALRAEDFPSRIEVPGRYRDVDIRSHINNIAIAELFSEARARFVRKLFEDLESLSNQFFVVGQQALFYAGEAHFPGHIEIGSGLFEIGGSSLRFGQGFINDGRCTAIAEAVLVFSTGKGSSPLPAALRARAEDFLFTGDRVPRQLAELTRERSSPAGSRHC